MEAKRIHLDMSSALRQVPRLPYTAQIGETEGRCDYAAIFQFLMTNRGPQFNYRWIKWSTDAQDNARTVGSADKLADTTHMRAPLPCGMWYSWYRQ